ncbi:hypothetical protein M407DRAFT_245287 [Tulasnella calospora MUT 4182]|uniref:Uncharacterized protein n=1 Tax=Tulasnella calospora MUT 4182 TaxID=1051891 RepID=A0A0C3Q1I1_9AGAM|nr:hypothetical protein M407DRAFT_245287 [Tulasnella calospora MUT 4182]
MYYSPTTEGVRPPSPARLAPSPSSTYAQGMPMTTLQSQVTGAQPSKTPGMTTRDEAMRPRGGGCFGYENCNCCCFDCGCASDGCCDDSCWCGCC